MAENYLPYGGIAGLLNSVKSEQEIKLFLTKYKKWYIRSHNLSKNEAEDRIKLDVRFFIDKFVKNTDLISKLNSIY